MFFKEIIIRFAFKFQIMKNIVIIAIVALFIVSCSKYEEGPSMSLASKTARLINDWEVEKVIENGIDITTDYKIMYPDQSFHYFRNYTLKQVENETELAKAWEWGEDKETIIITWKLLETEHVQTKRIIRLASSEFWYSTTLNEKSYIFNLKSKK